MMLKEFPKEEVKNRKQMVSLLVQGKYKAYLARHKNRIVGDDSFVGYALGYLDNNHNSFFLDYIQISSDYQGCGFGSQFLNLLQDNVVKGDNPIGILFEIEKPEWTFTENIAADTLIPDIITLVKIGDKKLFLILDAKYYYPQLEKGKIPKRQPGIESITKQFLYQLAYKRLIADNEYDVKNFFILPTEDENIQDKSFVRMQMFTGEPLFLEPILVKFIPTKEAYDLYLQNKKFNLKNIIGN